MIRSRHGTPKWKSRGEIGDRREGGKSGWWKRITGRVEGREGDWFWAKAVQRLGNGEAADFWNGAWPGQKPLKEIFPGLYHLIETREGLVKNMGRWDGGR